MTFVIALTGLSGAGKTTAADYFVRSGLGQKIYLGEIVLNEVRARGLESNPENERAVRIELREKFGLGVLLHRAAPRIRSLLNNGVSVFVDAIFEAEEYRILESCCESVQPVLLAVEATFETRSSRLRLRLERPLTLEDLKKRDETEISKLATGNVITHANHSIRNDGALPDFHAQLEQFLSAVRSGPSRR